MTPAIHRYLRATRHDLEILPASREFDEWVKRLLADGYSESAVDLSTIRIRSSGIRTEYVSISDVHYMIIDQELSETLAELALIRIMKPAEPCIKERIYLLLADCFRLEGNLPLAMTALKKASRHIELVSWIRKVAVNNANSAIPGTITILHELAHILLKSNSDKHDPIISAKRIVDHYLDSFKTLLKAYQSDENGEQKNAVEISQLSYFISKLANDPIFNEEAVCDVAAALAYINQKANADIWKGRMTDDFPLTPQMLASGLVDSVKVITNMQLVAAIRQFAKNVARGESKEVIDRQLGDLWLRNDNLIQCLHVAYRFQLSTGLLAKPPGGARKPNDIEDEDLFVLTALNYRASWQTYFVPVLKDMDKRFDGPAKKRGVASVFDDFSGFDELRNKFKVNDLPATFTSLGVFV